MYLCKQAIEDINENDGMFHKTPCTGATLKATGTVNVYCTNPTQPTNRVNALSTKVMEEPTQAEEAYFEAYHVFATEAEEAYYENRQGSATELFRSQISSLR
jgi:hypothetical protein